MAFKEMIRGLVAQGLIDKDHNLTQKGHDYVEKLKEDLRQRTIKNGEKHDHNERETEDIR